MLRVQAELETVIGTSTTLRLAPSSVEVAATVTVRIVMYIIRELPAVRNAIEQISVLCINSGTDGTTGPSFVDLCDEWSSVTSEETTGDGIFKNSVSVGASCAEKILSFCAVPVQAGAEVDGSEIVQTALNVVRG